MAHATPDWRLRRTIIINNYSIKVETTGTIVNITLNGADYTGAITAEATEVNITTEADSEIGSVTLSGAGSGRSITFYGPAKLTLETIDNGGMNKDVLTFAEGSYVEVTGRIFVGQSGSTDGSIVVNGEACFNTSMGAMTGSLTVGESGKLTLKYPVYLRGMLDSVENILVVKAGGQLIADMADPNETAIQIAANGYGSSEDNLPEVISLLEVYLPYGYSIWISLAPDASSAYLYATIASPDKEPVGSSEYVSGGAGTFIINGNVQRVNGVTIVDLENREDVSKLTFNEIGAEKTLSALISPDTASHKDVIWSSSNPDVVTVDENGKITTVGYGTATITVETEDGGYTDLCTVTVDEKTDEVPDVGDETPAIPLVCCMAAAFICVMNVARRKRIEYN